MDGAALLGGPNPRGAPSICFPSCSFLQRRVNKRDNQPTYIQLLKAGTVCIYDIGKRGGTREIRDEGSLFVLTVSLGHASLKR